MFRFPLNKLICLFFLSAFFPFSCTSSDNGCIKGDLKCVSDTTYMVCYANGEWGDALSCPQDLVCKEGRCKVSDETDGDSEILCSAGSSVCVGELIRFCSSEGLWEEPQSCALGRICQNNKCVDDPNNTNCEPGEKTCEGDTTLLTCNALGNGWDEKNCFAEEICSDKACIPIDSQICEALTETRCVDTTAYETCNAGGTGFENSINCGSDQTCYAGQCIDNSLIVCTPGMDMTCVTDTTLKACNKTGTGFSEPVSCPQNYICKAGECVEGNCNPGVDFHCTLSGDIEWCNPEGDGYLSPEPCPSDTVCVESSAGCVAENRVCEPNSTVCDENDSRIIHKCNEEGSGFLDETLFCDETQGKKCFKGVCADLCDIAALNDSYMGCEYWPVVLPNSVGVYFTLGDESEFAVVVSNTNSTLSANVTVEYMGDNSSKSVTVLPLKDKTIRLPYKRVICSDKNNVGTAACTYKSMNSFKLTSSIPVTVYQFNPITAKIEYNNTDYYANTNDASLLLPTHALGNEYLVMNYRSAQSTGDYLGSNGDSSPVEKELIQPSFFTVIGSEDNTSVTIKAKGALRASNDYGENTIQGLNPGESYTTTLNKGEVLQYASSEDYTYQDSATCKYDGSIEDMHWDWIEYCLGPELSGTEITSDKPVAVYAGNYSAFVPHYSWAADHLEQQLFPTKTWTTQYIVRRMHLPSSQHPNYVKILAKEDGTKLTAFPDVLNEAAPYHNQPCNKILNRGESCVLETFTDFLLLTNPGHPVMVGEFMVGQGHAFNWVDEGDPAFILVPPVEQYRKNYVFLVPETYNTSWITMMTTNPDIKIMLDDNLLNSSFTRLGNENFDAYVMEMKISSGTHTISADSRLGLLVYGFDEYVSYAYPAGLDLTYIQY